jgi:hypothetical protein
MLSSSSIAVRCAASGAFTPQKLSIELDRPRDNLVSVTLAMAATEFAEASQVVKIISGEIEPP